MTKQKKFIQIIVFIACVAVTFLIVKESQATSRSRALTKEDDLMRLAYEVIQNSESIFDLQNETNRLKTKNDSFSFDIKDKSKIKSEIETKIQNYKITNGSESITGSGLEIKIEGEMVTEEMVDLINGIRNSKSEAIGINGDRIIYRSYFIVKDNKQIEVDNKSYSLPVTIQVVGDAEVLRKSLDRPGGILDILKQNAFGKLNFGIINSASITLPAYSSPILFRIAKTVNN
jgi:uncharacterized protein YlxW (UPF0749 family)